MAKISSRKGAREAARLHATMGSFGSTFVLATDGRLLRKHDGTTTYSLIARRVRVDDPPARLAEAVHLLGYTPDGK